MGLLINITNDKGITLNYHRIERVTINSLGQAKMLVFSYVDYDKRDIEKKAVEKDRHKNEIYRKLSELESNLLIEDDEKRDSKKQSQIEEYQKQLEEIEDIPLTIDTHVSDKWYYFEGVDIESNYNYHSAYDMLKTLDDFIGAENHID